MALESKGYYGFLLGMVNQMVHPLSIASTFRAHRFTLQLTNLISVEGNHDNQMYDLSVLGLLKVRDIFPRSIGTTSLLTFKLGGDEGSLQR